MAYREFHYEKTYAAPDASLMFNSKGAVSALSEYFAGRRKQKADQVKAADQFKFDIEGGSFEKDTVLLNGMAKDVVASGKTDILSTGKISQNTDAKRMDALTLKQVSKNQFDRAKQLDDEITSKKDPYYNPEPDKKLVSWATHGENNDVDVRTRGQRLAEAEAKLGGIETFKFDNYRSDYVKKIGNQYKDIEFPLKKGGTQTKYDQATFWDDSGKPGVTDKHAVSYLESDQRVAQWYGKKIDTELQDEISKMKSSGDNRVSWMKDKNDLEIANELINDPSKNIINSKDYGIRIREKAKSDLGEADRINHKVSYTGTDDNSGKPWANKNIVHENSTNTFAQEVKTNEGMKPFTTYGVGGKIGQKNGRAIQLVTTNPIRTDINKGVTTRNNKGSVSLNMTGYQLMPVKKGFGPLAMSGKDADEMVAEIQRMPLEWFDPNGKVALQDDMKIGISGYTINEAAVLGDINDQMQDLATQMAEATKSGDKEKMASLQNVEFNLQEIKEMVGGGDYDPGELILAANKAGIRKIRQDMIIPADGGDVANIKNITGGFDLNDKNYWSDDMKEVNAAYKARVEEAKKGNYGKKTEEQNQQAVPEKKKTSIPTVANDADYQKLPSGSEYIGPDGKKRKKK